MCFATSAIGRGATIFSESFGNVAALTSSGGWFNTNLSNPVGLETWAQGNTGSFTAADATANYAGVGILSADPLAGSGVISNWASYTGAHAE